MCLQKALCALSPFVESWGWQDWDSSILSA